VTSHKYTKNILPILTLKKFILYCWIAIFKPGLRPSTEKKEYEK